MHLPKLRFLTRDEARDWTAILYTPVLTVCGIVLAAVLVWGPWPPETATQRLNFLGWSLIGLLFLIGLGTLFLQRRTANIKVETPGGSVEFEGMDPPKP